MAIRLRERRQIGVALGTGQLADRPVTAVLSPAGRRFHPRGGLPSFVTSAGRDRREYTVRKRERHAASTGARPRGITSISRNAASDFGPALTQHAAADGAIRPGST